MKIRRTIPPAAAPISLLDLLFGFYGIFQRKCIPKLEAEIKEYFGTRYVYLVSSGKAALFLILSGLKDLTGKKKVIIPAYTCFSVPSAIRMAGLEIVLCDMCPDTLDYDYEELKKLVDVETLCVLATHLLGIPSDVGRIRDLVAKYDVFVVEDVAQGMGAELEKKKLGTLGDVAFFSFGRGKNITCGSGGLIITSEENISNSIQKHLSITKPSSIVEYAKNIFSVVFQAIFIHPMLYWFPKGMPFLKIGETSFYSFFPVHPLTGFQAGLLTRWHRKLEIFNQNRVKNTEFYMKSLKWMNSISNHENGIPYLRFPLYVANKRIKEKLCDNADILGISPMYPCSVNKIKELEGNFPNNQYNKSEYISNTIISLPTHVLLKDKDLKKIIEICHLNEREIQRIQNGSI